MPCSTGGSVHRDPAPGRTGVQIVVVIPVRNEERRLQSCLAALDRARLAIESRRRGDPPVRVVVVLDRCSDGSGAIAAAHGRVEIVVTDHGRVGAARAEGIGFALATSKHPLGRTWIACTDGDSAVPTDWFQTQLDAANSGVDLLLGTVRPDRQEIGEPGFKLWHSQHSLADGHPHVFGANLGVSAEMYLRVGGFADVSAHEDQGLAQAVRLAGGHVLSTGASPVLTSGRVVGRTPAGFAHFLRNLTDTADPALVSAGARAAGALFARTTDNYEGSMT